MTLGTDLDRKQLKFLQIGLQGDGSIHKFSYKGFMIMKYYAEVSFLERKHRELRLKCEDVTVLIINQLHFSTIEKSPLLSLGL